MPASDLKPISIYVHWPFCLAKCPYCDFNSHVRENIDEAEMAAALLSEIDYFAGLVGKRLVKSIFFGGGTPSLMSASTVEAVINRVAGHFRLSDDIEISLEANPTSVEAGKFIDFAGAGVNRVSLGIQALNDDDLKALGREHSVAEALAAIELSQKHFKRSNFDLIYARMDQTMTGWQKELERALKMANGHLSLYQLTIEKGTSFYGRWRQGMLSVPGEDLAADMYDMTNEICDAFGYPAYEISNYAIAGEESRHNLTYWKYDDYIGIGAGAHGRITFDGQTYATEQNKKPETWLKNVQKQGHATKLIEPLDKKTMAEEMIMMGLRLTGGVNFEGFASRTGLKLQDIIQAEPLELLISQGFLSQAPQGQLRLTKKGRPLLNQILGQILA